MDSQLGRLLPDGQAPDDGRLEKERSFPSELLGTALEVSRHRLNVLAQLRTCLEEGAEKQALRLVAKLCRRRL